jgi:Na+/phosphate symporter
MSLFCLFVWSKFYFCGVVVLGGGSVRTSLDIWSNAVLVLREMRERFFFFFSGYSRTIWRG